ncbi:head GIN domain-containing protein [Qipengyuania sp. MTN3-11]|uniref:head GIN domain-containing protein n=1 Tax=Qipengyuania sp. MTN3-11 TaxID=3056557 RepID=UPI0036F26965
MAGCNYSMTVGDTDGVPLAQLDMSGTPPEGIVLAGPDRIIISDGEILAINVSGDAEAVELLRFNLEDGKLGIMRENGNWRDTGTAIVRVTMPSPRGITLAGSGNIEAASLSGDATEATIAGSGALRIARLTTGALDLNIMGSGAFAAAGNAERLDMNIAGSGSSKMRDLRVGDAEISIAGSGDGEFASDGTVEANIAGSGTVTVHGRAACTVNAMGSGKVICRDDARAETGARAAPSETEAGAGD